MRTGRKAKRANGKAKRANRKAKRANGKAKRANGKASVGLVNMAIGQRVLELRKARDLPQLGLAFLSRVNSNRIWLLEKHGIIPDRREIRERIAKALGVAYDDIWGDIDILESQQS